MRQPSSNLDESRRPILSLLKIYGFSPLSLSGGRQPNFSPLSPHNLSLTFWALQMQLLYVCCPDSPHFLLGDFISFSNFLVFSSQRHQYDNHISHIKTLLDCSPIKPLVYVSEVYSLVFVVWQVCLRLIKLTYICSIARITHYCYS